MKKSNPINKILRYIKGKPKKVSAPVSTPTTDDGYSPVRESAKKMFRKDKIGVDAKVKQNVKRKSDNYNRNAEVEKAKNSNKFSDHFNRNAKGDRIKQAEAKVRAAEAKDTKNFRRAERESVRRKLKVKKYLKQRGAVAAGVGVVAGVGYNEHRKNKNSWENVTKERIRGRQV